MTNDDETPDIPGAPEEKVEIIQEICDELLDGKTLTSILEETHFPQPSTFFKWLRQHPELRQMYDQAREDQAELLGDELMDISDNARNDWMERNGEDDAGYRLNGENIQRSKLRVETRKWLASKMNKRFSDKVNHNIGGQVDNPIVTRIERVIVDVEDTSSESL